MNIQLSNRIAQTVRQVVRQLVDKDYEGLARLTNNVRLNSAEIAEGVSEYGRTLVFPPERAFESLDVISIEGSNNREFAVTFDLHTVDEAPSDLSVEMTLFDDYPDRNLMRVELDNILVL